MAKMMILDVGWTNKGNIALVESTIEAINRFCPDTEFIFMGPIEISHKDFNVEMQGGFTSPQHAMISLSHLINCLYIYINKRFLKVQVPISENSFLGSFYSSNIIIISGGDSMSGEYGISILNTLINILYAILLEKPVVLYGCSIGYYKNKLLKTIANKIFNNVDLILVREELSKKYLDENHISKSKIYLTADPAFLLSPAEDSRVFEILSAEGICKPQRPIIGINASGLISRFKTGKERDAEIANIFAKIIDDLIEKLNAFIIMIPHVYSKGSDDRDAIALTMSYINNNKDVKLIKGEYTPQELKGIIGQCDLFIGARMHTTIASTSMIVPTIGIAYSHKMHGIIGDMLCQSNYIVDVNNLDYEKLSSLIIDAWTNRERIKKELDINVAIAKEKANLNGKLVSELLISLNNHKP